MRRGCLLCIALLVTLLAVSCKCASPPLATLTEVDGRADRDFSEAVNVWQSAAPGAAFDFGDAVRTLAESEAVVRFDDGALVRLEPSTTVRFQRRLSEEKTATLELEAGEATLESAGDPMRFHTELGPAVVLPGAVVHLQRNDKGLRVVVEVGRAELIEGGGQTRQLNAGQALQLSIGPAVLETARSDAGPAEKVEVPVDTRLLGTVQAGVVTVRPPGAAKAIPLEVGEHVLTPGATLRLRSGASMTVRQGNVSTQLSGPGTFVVGATDDDLVTATKGVMTLRADGQDVRAAIPGGSVVALGTGGLSIVDVETGADGSTTVLVRAGSARVTYGGKEVMLSAGLSGSMVRGSTTVDGRGLDYYDLPLSVGGSLVVHDGRPPSVVGFSLAGKCTHLGVVELMSGSRVVKRVVAQERANIGFTKGRHAYRARCLSKVGEWSDNVGEGEVNVYADSGSTQLPSSAPSNTINVDGRNYTLMYQHRLPAVTVRWPNAPKSSSYTLTVTSGGRARTLTSPSASYRFRSGALGEGRHAFQFRSDVGRVSRRATATIRFDNAAPKASISAPSDGGFEAGSTVEVRGIALPGWGVSAQGQALKLDSAMRFSGTVTAGERGIVFAFAHPERGTHYYLRKAKTASP